MKSFGVTTALTTLCLLSRDITPTRALTLDPTQPSQVRDVAKQVAAQLMALYANPTNGDIISGIPGLLTYPPYYWWEAGAMFGQMIDYWYYTNDSTYNDLVLQGMLHQVGEEQNLMPANQSKDEGNDDELFWAFTVMDAAEVGFTNPPPDQLGWLALAQSVFNQLVSRWDTSVCSGGVRWQIDPLDTGWNYKNTPANGGMFQLAARLAKYTGNDTYAQWATTTYNWMASTPLISSDLKVADGMDTTLHCTQADNTQWTYNYGIMIGGAAYMYNYTNGSAIWGNRLQGFLNNTAQFFPEATGGVMVEICDASQKCNPDQLSFKAYLARWMAVAAQVAPFTEAQILPRLRTSAIAAARQCDAGPSNAQCGSQWTKPTSDGNMGVGQQMTALSVISANMITQVRAPYSSNNGGTSKGNPAAGTGAQAPNVPIWEPVTTADRAGAGIITTLALGFTIGGAWWLIT